MLMENDYYTQSPTMLLHTYCVPSGIRVNDSLARLLSVHIGGSMSDPFLPHVSEYGIFLQAILFLGRVPLCLWIIWSVT